MLPPLVKIPLHQPGSYSVLRRLKTNMHTLMLLLLFFPVLFNVVIVSRVLYFLSLTIKTLIIYSSICNLRENGAFIINLTNTKGFKKQVMNHISLYCRLKKNNEWKVEKSRLHTLAITEKTRFLHNVCN